METVQTHMRAHDGDRLFSVLQVTMLGICLCLSVAVRFAVSQEAEAQEPVTYMASSPKHIKAAYV